MHGDYLKQKTAIRYWLQGRNWHLALAAMEMAEHLHRGVRKDGVTPEFAHQIWIANFVRTLSPMLESPEAAIACAFLHDVPEDYGVGLDDLDRQFGAQVAQATWRLSKIRGGHKLADEIYYAELATDRLAALVKGVDRTHNLGSMIDAFTPQKQVSYIEETRRHVLPMLKRARRRFTSEEPAFENIKQILVTRISLIEAIHAAKAP